MMTADSNEILSHGERDGEQDYAEPFVDEEEVRMLKTLTREKARIVIARRLRRSLDALYGLAAMLGVLLGGDKGRKETW
jgi:hypothetical protein